MELSLDSPREKRKTDVTNKSAVSASTSASASVPAPASSLSAAASLAKPQPSVLEEVRAHLMLIRLPNVILLFL